MTISESLALLKIMEIVSLPGEICNDGECLDMIIHLLDEMGLPVKQEIDRMQKEYVNSKIENWDNLDIDEIISTLQGDN